MTARPRSVALYVLPPLDLTSDKGGDEDSPLPDYSDDESPDEDDPDDIEEDEDRLKEAA